MRSPVYPPGTRVIATLVDDSRVAGVVTKIARNGHIVKLDDGRTKPVAWWRLSREASPS